MRDKQNWSLTEKIPEDAAGTPQREDNASGGASKKLAFVSLTIIILFTIVGILGLVFSDRQTKLETYITPTPTSMPTPTTSTIDPVASPSPMEQDDMDSPFSGEVYSYRLELDSFTVKIDFQSSAGLVVKMRVWPADKPEPTYWEDFKVLVTVPWEFTTDTLNVRLQDDRGHISDIFEGYTSPRYSPPSID